MEEAAALADLGFAYQSPGDNKRSRGMMNRAWHGAKRCGAEPLCRELSGMFPPRPGHAWEASGAVAAPVAEALPEGLSEAELRVASLAAMGHTNREISRELFITVSTVEQHLTRVYRKLNVGKRGQLLDRLGLAVPGGAATA
ncbi:DNA-binding CsgD family transcriptional regulator [Kitasatospora sp. MAP12-15]|uniref:helix-turn-helix domain-containing protein n=1 Tax=unclassified Kitasatospora TaxID=2633591 RepID=UPI002477053F|nr:helix-turn-helix transcriptional regulator [Kitasatospora sp. MAP12-44]MDH6108039.1 DNA-binding CsgD family transcriptional regulator [Kitasatospora sp. MAP12-44]